MLNRLIFTINFHFVEKCFQNQKIIFSNLKLNKKSFCKSWIFTSIAHDLTIWSSLPTCTYNSLTIKYDCEHILLIGKFWFWAKLWEFKPLVHPVDVSLINYFSRIQQNHFMFVYSNVCSVHRFDSAWSRNCPISRRPSLCSQRRSLCRWKSWWVQHQWSIAKCSYHLGDICAIIVLCDQPHHHSMLTSSCHIWQKFKLYNSKLKNFKMN